MIVRFGLCIGLVFFVTGCTNSPSVARTEIERITAMSRVVIGMRDEGKFYEAAPKAAAMLKDARALLGSEHQLVAEALNNLALLQLSLGQLTEAERLLLQALEMRKKLFGNWHPDVGSSLNDLATVYGQQGRYAEAVQLYGQALSIRERSLGKSHADVAQTLNDLGATLAEQGLYAKAEPELERALAICRKVYAGEHRRVAAVLNNLGSLRIDQGRLPEAEIYYQEALRLRRRLLPAMHPDVSESLDSLASLRWYQRQYPEAERFYLEALEIDRKLGGEEHPNVATGLSNLAGLYTQLQRYQEAEQLFQKGLAVRRKILGNDHVDLATTLNNFGMFYLTQGRRREAEPLLQEALTIRSKQLGNHPLVALTLTNLALLKWRSGESSVHKTRQYLRRLADVQAAVLSRELKQGSKDLESIRENVDRVRTFAARTTDLALLFAFRNTSIAEREDAETALLAIWSSKGRWEDEGRWTPNRPQLSISAVRAALPPKTVLLEWATFQERSDGREPIRVNPAQRGDQPEHYAVCVLAQEASHSVVCLDLGKVDYWRPKLEYFREKARKASLTTVVGANGQVVRNSRNEPVRQGGLSPLDARMQQNTLWRRLHTRSRKSPYGLGDILLLPQLRGAEQFFIAPDGEWHGIAFAGLRIEGAADIGWGDRFTMAHLSSGRDLVWRKAIPNAKGAPGVLATWKYARAERHDSVAGVHDGMPCQDQPGDYETLPLLRELAVEIAERWKVPTQYQLITPAAATRARAATLFGAVHAPSRLLIAAHGCILQGNGSRKQEQPELVLAVSKDREDGRDPQWEYMPVSDLAKWNLSGSEIYVISCWAQAPTSSLLGDLRQVSSVGGARLLMAPLWQVQPADAHVFLRAFFGAREAGATPGEAMRIAQKQFPRAELARWGGYVLSGPAAFDVQ